MHGGKHQPNPMGSWWSSAASTSTEPVSSDPCRAEFQPTEYKLDSAAVECSFACKPVLFLSPERFPHPIKSIWIEGDAEFNLMDGEDKLVAESYSGRMVFHCDRGRRWRRRWVRSADSGTATRSAQGARTARVPHAALHDVARHSVSRDAVFRLVCGP